MRPVESLVHMDFLTFGLLCELKRLELFSDPVAYLTVLNVHELDSDLTTIGVFISLNELS